MKKITVTDDVEDVLRRSPGCWITCRPIWTHGQHHRRIGNRRKKPVELRAAHASELDAAKLGREPTPNGPDRWSDVGIMFCNHEGWFKADLIITPEAVTVLTRNNRPVTPDTLRRTELERAEYRIVDHLGGYWNPGRGVFVLPRNALTLL